ncbi:AbrB/MazE/SpoVT family DNA-binding domain-containing protein [Candidatus Palauibacter sp.]|uniref:AbrB/MazE/SpoVT family DNA-binding domain-containing protein n=1 Tax=Candidatus Palauibacter sp. TaxID=3101350 RepID=UPI003AF2FC44
MADGTGYAALGSSPDSSVDTERVTIDEAGRLVVPARFRRALGIRGRQQLLVGLEGDTIRLRTVRGALARLQALAARNRQESGSVVDAFILERRAEAARE